MPSSWTILLISRSLIPNSLLISDEIVIGPRISDRIITLENLAHGKAGSGEKPRAIDAFKIHVLQALRHVVTLDITEASAQPRVHSERRHQGAAPDGGRPR